MALPEAARNPVVQSEQGEEGVELQVHGRVQPVGDDAGRAGQQGHGQQEGGGPAIRQTATEQQVMQMLAVGGERAVAERGCGGSSPRPCP